MLRPLLGALLLLALAAPASANWTRAQRAHFLGQCVERCQSTLKLPDSKRAECDRTCGCVADQAETQVTPADRNDGEAARLLPRLCQTLDPDALTSQRSGGSEYNL